MDEAKLTYWMDAVWITFNPSWDEKVIKVKQLYAEIIDLMNQIRNECTARPSEKARLCSVAITEAQWWQMRAVKAITWKE